MTTRFYAVELNDPHPVWGGKTIRSPFTFRREAEVYAEREVAAAKEMGMGDITARVYAAEQAK